MNCSPITITELIAGQRMGTCENMKEIEENVQEVIVYSEKEISTRTSLLSKKYLISFGVFIASVIAIRMAFLWWRGFFSIVDCLISLNEEIQLTIFNRDVTEQRFSRRPTITIKSKGSKVSATVYGDSYHIEQLRITSFLSKILKSFLFIQLSYYSYSLSFDTCE